MAAPKNNIRKMYRYYTTKPDNPEKNQLPRRKEYTAPGSNPTSTPPGPPKAYSYADSKRGVLEKAFAEAKQAKKNASGKSYQPQTTRLEKTEGRGTVTKPVDKDKKKLKKWR